MIKGQDALEEENLERKKKKKQNLEGTLLFKGLGVSSDQICVGNQVPHTASETGLEQNAEKPMSFPHLTREAV